MTSNVKKLISLCVRARNVHQPSILICGQWSQLCIMKICDQGNQQQKQVYVVARTVNLQDASRGLQDMLIYRVQWDQNPVMTRTVNLASLFGQWGQIALCSQQNSNTRKMQSDPKKRQHMQSTRMKDSSGEKVQSNQSMNLEDATCYVASRKLSQDVTSTTKASTEKKHKC